MDWNELKEQLLSDPEFAAAYKALEAEYEEIRSRIAARDRAKGQLEYLRRLPEWCDLEVLASDEMWR